MKAIIMTENGLKLSETQKPVPGDSEVLVKIEWASVCGSDYPFLNGVSDKSHLIGRVMGHEGAGAVVESRAGFQTGEKVAFESHRARQEWLSQGKDAYKDPEFAIIGYRGFAGKKPPQGTWAEFIAVPAVYLHRIPQDIYDFYPGSLWEPLGNSIRLASFINNAFPNKENQIVFSGCGPQGVLAMLVLSQYFGYKNLVAIEVSAPRLRLVKEFGIARAFSPDEIPDIAPSLWVEVSGSLSAFQLGMKTVPKGGKMILFGLVKKEYKLDGIAYNDFVLGGRRAEIEGKELIGVSGRLSEDWELTPKIIRALKGKVNLKSLYSYYGPLQNLPHIFETEGIPSKNPGFMKAVFSGFV